MVTEKLQPSSGFLSWDFLLSIVTMVGTVLLNLVGLSPDVLRLIGGQNAVTQGPILAVVAVCAYLVFQTIRRAAEARNEEKLPAANAIEVRQSNLFGSSEFWVSALSLLLQVLQQNNILVRGLNSSVTTSFFVLAIVYTLTRSQFKLAFLRSQIFRITKQAKATGPLRDKKK